MSATANTRRRDDARAALLRALDAHGMTEADLAACRADPKRAPAWMRPPIAEAIFGFSGRTIRRWASCRQIRTARPGDRGLLIERDSLIAFIEGAAAA